jgi:uncharacterized protein (TIGR00661 family)
MKPTRVLVAPLDWGLGHATRCIPIIKALQQRGCEVFLGGNGPSLELLHKEFPGLDTVKLPAYNPVYPSNLSMVVAMIFQLPKFIRVINDEHREIGQYIARHAIDLIISDNRYGCWSRSATSIFITHQTNLRMPAGLRWMEPIVNYYNRRQLKKFTRCWIPDLPERQLSGELSTGATSLTVDFIGPLSQFSAPRVAEIKYDILFLLSGPEPQRSVLEKIITGQIEKSDLRILLVRGVLENDPRRIPGHVKSVNFLATDALQTAIEQTALVISRSGYSTIMDLARLGKKMVCIPTPGQTEQLYLASLLEKYGIANFVSQDAFDIQRAWQVSAAYTGFSKFIFSDDRLNNVITDLLTQLKPRTKSIR